MLVDDHAVLREGLRFMLSGNADIDVVAEAADGFEALGLLADGEDVDVVMMDIKMPNLDGLDTLRRIRASFPTLPVIILSMYDDPGYVEEAVRSGATGYLLKSVDIDELTRAVQAASEGEAYLQPDVTKPLLRRFAAAPAQQTDISLSDRERQVLQLVADGKSTKQAARELDISESTVKTYLRTLFHKLGAEHRAHAVALALRHRIIE
jgi:DNA-binding NarL/FixJ family response regulator